VTRQSTAAEILDVAMQMERTGRDLYEALALASDDARVRAFCRQAVSEETAHLLLFQRLRQECADQPVVNSAGAGRSALHDVARRRILPNPAEVRKVALGGTLEDVLRLAVRMEEEAIAFYRGMKARLPALAEAIQDIVDEEESHLADLRRLAG
jgi:rubrerythrin